jgi:uncharacterized protein YecE (DUF72 family)
MARILIGTSGYDYLEWRDLFYPRETARQDFLDFYAGSFPTVELNFSYYRMPEASALGEMVRRSGGRLDFSIKAHRSMTHEVDPGGWKEAVRLYRRALSPLEKAGRLGAVLLQIPQSFHYDPEKRRYLDSLLKELDGLPLVVELRHAAWQNTRVYDALRKRKVGICVTDMPNLKGLPQATEVVTSELGYVRFHGRNAETWWGTDAGERYNYLYGEDELAAWADRIVCMKDQVRTLRVYFNNHRAGQAVKNAEMLRKILKGRSGDVAPPG